MAEMASSIPISLCRTITDIGSVSAMARMPERMSEAAFENVREENPRLRSCSVSGYTPRKPPNDVAVSGVSISGCTILQCPLNRVGLPKRIYSVVV